MMTPMLSTLGVAATLLVAASVSAQSPAQGPEGTAALDSVAAADTVPHGWGALEPGAGFEVARTEYGSLSVSAYGLFRYLNQMPAQQSYTDHLGRERVVDVRNDLQFHRVQIFFKGWVYDPKLRYVMNVWTVNATGQVAVVGSITYLFHKAFRVAGGVNGMPGTRSLAGSHPYWLAPDRVMADEFVRPGFTSALWATGEILPRFHYTAMIGTNLSELGISAGEDTRNFAYGATVWWMPTTGEFGERGGYGDFEGHERVATRVGTSWTFSRENRYSAVTAGPENVSIRLSDGVNLFDRGALAEDVVVREADYQLNSIDVGVKYRGFWLQAEAFFRRLDDFDADGPLAVSSIVDNGFYVQGSYMLVPRTLEIYAAASMIDGEFNDPWEVLGGLNVYPARTRNFRVNAQVINIHESPVNSVFGYYVGGQTGTTVSASVGVLF